MYLKISWKSASVQQILYFPWYLLLSEGFLKKQNPVCTGVDGIVYADKGMLTIIIFLSIQIKQRTINVDMTTTATRRTTLLFLFKPVVTKGIR